MESERHDRFESLYVAHYADVLRYAIRRAGRDGADDVAAEVFLTVWRRLDQAPNPALPWLYGVAHRVMANHRRAAGRWRALREQVSLGDSPKGDFAEGVVKRTEILDGFDQLAPKDKEVLALIAWEELSIEEAAIVLGCSRGAVRVRLHRARRRLERRLSSHEVHTSARATREELTAP